MKEMFGMFMVTMIPITCFSGATFLAYHQQEGWGWLIFAGIVIGGSVKFSIK